MTNVEAVEWLKKRWNDMNEARSRRWVPENIFAEEIDVYGIAIKALESQTEVNIYDHEETYHNCTVQVLTNTVTGQTSIGWWQE